MTGMVFRIGPAIVVLGLGMLALHACGGSANQPFPVGSGGTTSSTPSMTTSSDSTGLGGGLGAGCKAECATEEFCSVTGVCIAKGTCVDKEDCGMGLTCDTASSTCVPGSECGAQEEAAKAVPPNLLIVLDRSCSMTSLVNGKSKWLTAVEALNGMMVSHKDGIRFGLTMFPDKVTPSCSQDKIPFSPAAGNEAAISATLTNSLQKNDVNYPAGPCVTNIDTALLQAKGEPALMDPARASYVMLVTDGAQSANCTAGGGDKGSTQVIADLLAAKVKTFVIGFGGTGIDKAALNAFADAGGTPVNNGTIHYYDAADAASLDQALSAIAAETLSCTYALDKMVPDPDQLFVFFDNNPTPVSRDPTHVNGWDFDAATNSITFYGMACQNLKNATVKDLDIVYGCAAPTPT